MVSHMTPIPALRPELDDDLDPAADPMLAPGPDVDPWPAWTEADE